MPVVFRESGLRYFFYSNEGSPREPPHVHVKGGRRDAKIWLEPEVSIADSFGFSPRELARVSCRSLGTIETVSSERGMSISPTTVRFDEHTMWVELADGRTIGVPLAWFPRLLRATPAERQQVELSRTGLHWEALDEDISVAGLLAGRGDMTQRPERAA